MEVMEEDLKRKLFELELFLEIQKPLDSWLLGVGSNPLEGA